MPAPLTDSPPADSALRVANLSVYHGNRPVVAGVSLNVPAGEIFGLVGPSGAGKSSLLLALNGAAVSTGDVWIGDEKLSGVAPRQRRLGLVYQEFRLFDWMSVEDNVAFPCRAQGWPRGESDAAVSAALERVSLAAHRARPVRDLSGGERQRVALARAMVFRPRALLLDEPFAHLDPPLREELRRDLASFLEECAIPVILVTHDHQEAFALCDRVAILIAGVLVQQGTPAELLARPCAAVVARHLGFSNQFRGRLLERSGETATIQLHGASTPLRGTAPDPIALGAAVIAMCRPEAMRLAAIPSGQLQARILAVHGTPEQTTLEVGLSDGTLCVVRTAAPPVGQAGDLVTLSVAADDLMVFPDPAR